MTPDHYDVLMIGRDADPSEIRAAFRALIGCGHPDRSTAPDAGARSAAIIDAYRTLSHPDRRRGYDRRRAQAVGAASASGRRSAERRRPPHATGREHAWATLATLWAAASAAIVLSTAMPLLQASEGLPGELVRDFAAAGPGPAR